MSEALYASECGVDVEELTEDAARDMFDREVSDRLGLTRQEFLARLDRGEYDGQDDETIFRLRMLAPFGR